MSKPSRSQKTRIAETDTAKKPVVVVSTEAAANTDEKDSEKKQDKKGSVKVHRIQRKRKPLTGVLRISGLPLGFAEPQLKKYFSQFGKVLRVTIARSRKTANPKGWGYVEFEELDVAKIVAQEIPKYMMFGKTMRIQHKDDLDRKGIDIIFKNSGRVWHRPQRGQVARHQIQNRLAKSPEEVKERMDQKKAALLEKFRSVGIEASKEDF